MPFIEYIEPEKPPCRSQEHYPPKYIVLKPGTHVWECPDCGEKEVIEQKEITL